MGSRRRTLVQGGDLSAHTAMKSDHKMRAEDLQEGIQVGTHEGGWLEDRTKADGIPRLGGEGSGGIERSSEVFEARLVGEWP